MAAVEALVRAQRLSVTGMGRQASTRSQARYGIKRIDRLASNARLHRELTQWYAAVAAVLLEGLERAVVLVDWTKLNGDFWALLATITFEGRSLPPLTRAFSKKLVGNRRVQHNFVKELQKVLPEGGRAALIADAGFRTTFIHACERVRVDCVIRLRNARGTIERSCWVEDPRTPFSEVFETATDKAQCLGRVRAYAASANSIWGQRVVLGPKPPKGDRRPRYRDDYYRQRGCEPFSSPGRSRTNRR